MGSRTRLRGRIDKASTFIGRDALLRQQAEGLEKSAWSCSRFDDPAAFPWGGEPILMNGRNVGELTSAGYSRKHGRAVAMGYARSDRVADDAALLAARYAGRHRRRAVRRHAASEASVKRD